MRKPVSQQCNMRQDSTNQCKQDISDLPPQNLDLGGRGGGWFCLVLFWVFFSDICKTRIIA